ncbi:MAG: cold shock domain-containing protein [Thermodesulfobacteriota bacterium]
MDLQTETRNLDMRPEWAAKIEDERQRLARHHQDLVHHLRLSIEATTGHRQGGHELTLVATVPGDTVVVKRKGEAVKGLIVEAFDTLGAQLKEWRRKRRQDVKTHETGAAGLAGTVKSVIPAEGYGFIATADGTEIYFHENALKDCVIRDLNEGDGVRFAETTGDKGPQASWVRVIRD